MLIFFWNGGVVPIVFGAFTEPTTCDLLHNSGTHLDVTTVANLFSATTNSATMADVNDTRHLVDLTVTGTALD